MKPFLLFFILSSITFKSICQQKFIEVNVADTVMAKADIFIYSVNILKDEDPYDDLQYKNPVAYEKKKMQLLVKQKNIYDSIKHELSKAGLNVLPASLKETVFVSGNENVEYRIDVITYSKDSLLQLFNKLKNNKSIVGVLLSVVARDESPYYKLLYEKMMHQAKNKATMIAATCNEKIGNILSVIENKEESETGGWTAYPPLSALRNTSVIPGWHTTIYPQSRMDAFTAGDYSISNSLTVRFAIE